MPMVGRGDKSDGQGRNDSTVRGRVKVRVGAWQGVWGKGRAMWQGQGSGWCRVTRVAIGVRVDVLQSM